MKLRLSILLLAAALAASPAAGQTIKSLGYNTTNGVVPTSLSTNTLRFTNAEGLQFNKLTTENMVLGTNGVMTFYSTNSGFGFSAGATAAQFCDDLGLGTSNSVLFGSVEVGGGDALYLDGAGIESGSFGGKIDFEEQRLTQDDLTVFSWATNSFSVTPAATFATNVTVNGNLSVGSLTTTTPSTWALDATETAAATNGVLALPSNANVIRLTNNNAISGVSGGVLGAFYYLVNQTTNAVTISNVGGITVQGGTPLTLGANQAATLVATGATNASVAARGDLTDVTLGGTANTAPSQTASSGASLMTRDLVGQEFATPRTKMQTTYWFSMEGLGLWQLVNSGAALAVNRGPKFGPSLGFYTGTRSSANAAGLGLRWGAAAITGGSMWRPVDGGAFTARTHVVNYFSEPSTGNLAFAFSFATGANTNFWAQANSFGLFWVKQPINSWAASTAFTANDRIAVGNVVWAVATAGTTDTSEPVWTDLINSTVTNGTAVFRNLGPHTSNNWVLAIGSTNASEVVMTNTGKSNWARATAGGGHEVLLTLRYGTNTTAPYTVYGSVADGTGQGSEVTLNLPTNTGVVNPQYWMRYDSTNASGANDVAGIRYFSIDAELPPLNN